MGEVGAEGIADREICQSSPGCVVHVFKADSLEARVEGSQAVDHRLGDHEMGPGAVEQGELICLPIKGFRPSPHPGIDAKVVIEDQNRQRQAQIENLIPQRGESSRVIMQHKTVVFRGRGTELLLQTLQVVPLLFTVAITIHSNGDLYLWETATDRPIEGFEVVLVALNIGGDSDGKLLL